MSHEERALYQAYRKKEQKQMIIVLITQIILLGILIAGWEWASATKRIDPLLFSRPTTVLETVQKLWHESALARHIAVTVAETVAGFLLGTASGILIATALWFSPFLARVMDPYLVVLNSMPKVALGPLFIVAFGSGMTSILMMALAVSVIVTALVVHGSFKETDPNYIKLARTFGASRRQIFTTIVFPAARPSMLSALKVNVGLSWIGVIVGEFLAAKEGLGYVIIYGFQIFNFNLVMTSIVLIAVLSAAMYQVVAVLTRRFER
ncbi:MAG: ABC transporter permease [Hydrogenibacillus sp.]|nr:ABC transporter permease [Hydrogenibacillus sp.]